MTIRMIHVALLLVSNASICSFAAQDKNATQTTAPKPIKVDTGFLQATVEDGLTIYRGIPYAAPPWEISAGGRPSRH